MAADARLPSYAPLVSSYQDDVDNTLTLPFNFYFGGSMANSLKFSSNCYLEFRSSSGSAPYGTLNFGKYDRAMDYLYISAAQYASSVVYVTILASFRFYYSATSVGDLVYQIRIARSASKQFVEIRAAAAMDYSGLQGKWELLSSSSGTLFGLGTLLGGQSLVLSSDVNGNDWVYHPGNYLWLDSEPKPR